MQFKIQPLKKDLNNPMPDSQFNQKKRRLSLGNLKKMKKKTWLIIGIIVIALIALKVFVFKSDTQKAANVQTTTAQVTKGTVQKTITATGTTKFSQTMPLSFEVSGTLQEIYVTNGDVVKKGDPLASLDTTTLEQQLKEEQQNYASAQANYNQTLGDLGRKLKSSLVSAEKSLLTAQQKADPDYLENQVYLAEMNLEAASQKLAQAQGSGETDTYQLQAALSQAQLNLKDVQNAKNGGAAKDLEVAQDQYDAAKAALSDFEQGAGSDYLSAKAALTKSETELMTAQQDLADAILKAPQDGTIVSCSAEQYQNVAGQSTVMTLVANPKDFSVTASVDQTEITELKSGQKANLTMDTVADTVLIGTVETVSLAGNNNQNVVTYEITIKVDEPTELLRDQMSVNVSIVTDEAKDVLTIPSAAVITRGGATGVLVAPSKSQSTDASQPAATWTPDSSSSGNQRDDQGSSSLSSDTETDNSTRGTPPSRPSAMAGANSGNSGNTSAGTKGNYQFVEIEIGLDDGTNVEVISGLTEGQGVIIQTVIASSNSPSGNTNYNNNNLRSLTRGGTGGPPSGGMPSGGPGQ